MQRVQHVSPGLDDARARLLRLRRTVLYRLDGPWGQPAWYTLNDIVKGAPGAQRLPGRPTGIMVAVLVSARLVVEGPEICLDGACMYKVRQYALSPQGHVALAQSFVHDTGMWTAEDAEAAKEAAKRARKRKLT